MRKLLIGPALLAVGHALLRAWRSHHADDPDGIWRESPIPERC